MHDIDEIEAINADQLVTATDWLLLRAVRKSRPMARGSSMSIQDAPTMHVRIASRRSGSVVMVIAAALAGAASSAALAILVIQLLT
jgi:hypothetical protein